MPKVYLTKNGCFKQPSCIPAEVISFHHSFGMQPHLHTPPALPSTTKKRSVGATKIRCSLPSKAQHKPSILHYLLKKYYLRKLKDSLKKDHKTLSSDIYAIISSLSLLSIE